MAEREASAHLALILQIITSCSTRDHQAAHEVALSAGHHEIATWQAAGAFLSRIPRINARVSPAPEKARA
jgi:hypothetical protein